ncbi:SEL1-like repeat protein [Allobaculum sp. Allo2]|nr:SEL1-like repeat protein [Allobaculum sp. Allo2]
MGLAYLRGVDTKRNPARAIPLLNQAAEKGVDQALLVLSDIYLYGDGVPVDPRKGVEFLKRYFAKTIQSFKDQPSTETIERLLDITIRYLNTLTRLGWFEELNTTCASVLHPILLLLEDIPYDLSPYDSTPFKILFMRPWQTAAFMPARRKARCLSWTI